MPALSLGQLGVGAGLGTSGEAALRPVSGVQRAAFDDAMARQGVRPPEAAPMQAPSAPQPAAAPTAAQAAQAASGATAPGYENSAAAKGRVARSLELGSARSTGDGDAILGGLQKLRGTFDARQQRIGEIMRSNAVDTNALLAMQMEVAQYTLLVDVSSKLTGKTTQSLDSLMKGS